MNKRTEYHRGNFHGLFSDITNTRYGKGIHVASIKVIMAKIVEKKEKRTGA